MNGQIETENYQFGFEKLEVWNSAVNFVENIYSITSTFPKDEIYGLISQIRRAAVSVASNIAEGTSKQSLKDQARFTEISFGSLMEVLNQLIIANKLKYINEENLYNIRQKIIILSRQINGLKQSQLRRYNEK